MNVNDSAGEFMRLMIMMVGDGWFVTVGWNAKIKAELLFNDGLSKNPEISMDRTNNLQYAAS